MSDISITISADPTKAIDGIKQTEQAAKGLQDASNRMAQQSDAAATNAMNQVITVSNQARQSLEQASGAVASVGSEIKTAAGEAAKVSGAFGEAVPVVGKLGSAIAAAVTGPLGAITATVGLAIAAIKKMIADVEDRLAVMRASAGSQANSAYDRLMQSRDKYAADLRTVEQVKEIDAIAQKTALTAQQLAQFRQLASQVGIDESYVTFRGIRGDALQRAEHSLNQQRTFWRDQEYTDFLTASGRELGMSIQESNLSDAWKQKLKGRGVLDLADTIIAQANRGSGSTMDEYKSWQDLASIARRIVEVREMHNRNDLGDRSQAEINSAIVEGIKAATAQDTASSGAGAGSSGSPKPGTLAWAKEQDRIAQQEAEAQQRREDAGAKLTAKLEQEVQIQQMIVDGKAREADILRQRISVEAALGRKLTSAEEASIEQLAGTLYDLRHPQDPLLAPEPNAPQSVARSRGHLQSYTMPLDRLQRIGANVANPVASAEKVTMDRQLSVQESIRDTCRQILAGTGSSNSNTLVFP